MYQVNNKPPLYNNNGAYGQQTNKNYRPQLNHQTSFGMKKKPVSIFALLSFLLLPLLINAQSFLDKREYSDDAKVTTTSSVGSDDIYSTFPARQKTAPPNKFIVDGNNPLVNEADYNKINDLLADGNTVIVAFNKTQNGTTDQFVSTVFNTYFEGIQATTLDNKLLITIDGSRFRESRSTKLNFAFIDRSPWDEQMIPFKRDIKNQVFPNLERAATQQGELQKSAVGQAVIKIAELAKEHGLSVEQAIKEFSETPYPARRNNSRSSNPSNSDNNIPWVMILTILGLLGAGGAVTYKVVQLNRSRKKDVQQVKETLKLAESDYNVGTFNVYKPKTLNALMNITPKTGDIETSLISSFDLVTPKVLKTHRPVVYNALVSEKGLYNDSAKVRQWVVNQLATTDGFIDRHGELGNYYELVELLRQEKSGLVQEALVKGLIPHTEEGDIDFLQQETVGNDGLELLRLHLFNQFPKPEYVDNFLTQLETEHRPTHRNSLLELTSSLVSQYSDKADSLLPYISSNTKSDFREMAIQTLGNTESPQFFTPLLNEYSGETGLATKETIVQALQQTLSEAHEKTTFYPVLKGKKDNIAAEQLAWKILSGKSEHVEPLISYLELPHTRFPEEAITLLATSVDSSHSERLQGILKNYEQSVTTTNENQVADYEPVLGAIAGLNELKDTEALNELFELIDNPELQFAHSKIMQALEATPNDNINFTYLQGQLSTNPSEASKVAAIALLDNYGQQALPLLLDTFTSYAEPMKATAEQSILRVARNNENCYTTLLDSANNDHPVAEKAVLEYFNNWQTQYDYDDIDYRNRLKNVSKKNINETIRSMAGRVYTGWVNQKANECETMGQNTSINRSTEYTKTINSLLNYRDAEEETIQAHANGGLSILAKRLGDSADVDSSSDYDDALSAVSTIEHQTDSPVEQVAKRARLKLEERRSDYLVEQERLRREAARRQQEMLDNLASKSTTSNGFTSTTSAPTYRSTGGYGTKAGGAM